MQAICRVPVSPMRAASNQRSEMVSQLLFGELVEILEEADDWTRIRSIADGYEGWCQPAHLIPLQQSLTESVPAYASDWINPVMVDEEIMWVPFGSRIDLVMQPAFNMEFFFRGNQIHPGGVSGLTILTHATK